jgi:hypothetical protein
MRTARARGARPRIRRAAVAPTLVLVAMGALAFSSGIVLGSRANRSNSQRGDAKPTFPFPRSREERRPSQVDALPKFSMDGKPCSEGCRAPGARAGWPLRPFNEQHPLRAGMNERRPSGFHVGVDIQAKNGTKVYAMQPGHARIIESSGSDERVQVGNFVYWHVRTAVNEGEYVEPYQTVVGTVKPTAGHLHLSERGPDGRYLNPLRPGGRMLGPWSDKAPPVIGVPEFRPRGEVFIRAFDPQSFTREVPYETPVLAPAALAWQLIDKGGRRRSPLYFAYRGSQHLQPRLGPRVWAPDARNAAWRCFAAGLTCKPNWHYRLAGGLAPPLSPHSRGRLAVYAWDWAGNTTVRDFRLPKNVRRSVRRRKPDEGVERLL